MYQRDNPGDVNSLSLQILKCEKLHMGESDNNSIMFGVSWELGVEGLLLNAAASRQGASHEEKRLEEKTWPNILIVGDVGIFLQFFALKGPS